MPEIIDALAERGAVVSQGGERPTVRHYGDPAAEYRAATEGCGMVYRSDRGMLRVHGRAPRQMLQGILTCSIPGPPAPTGEGEWTGAELVYGAILTPKGRLVTDLEVCWLGSTETDGLGLDVPLVGRAGAHEHFGKFLPPRFAEVEDLSEALGLLTMVGPGAEAALTGAVGRAPGSGFVLLEGGPLQGGLMVARGVEQVPSWDVWAPVHGVVERWRVLEAGGCTPVGEGVWETLRVESGYPRFGVDMTEETIPIEAGIGDRAFDHKKGCYTGQEVIVRILHRGHVNWHLRALHFGESAPSPGDLLFQAEGTKAVGRVTSSVESPAFGGVVGMGYVRREVAPPATLHLGGASGPPVRVEVLPAELPPA